MDFKTSQKLYSQARMGKYLNACSGNKAKAMQLYRYNFRLSQCFYGVLSIFEIILRNAIDRHYATKFQDKDWIIHQTSVGQLLHEDAVLIAETEAGFRKHGVYSSDKMVASFTMGFWTYLFTKNNYKRGEKTLLQIFPNKAKNLNQAEIYQDLTHIREFRNRIAHHEPICFDAKGGISTAFARRHYQLIKDYITYFGQDADDVLSWAERPDVLLSKLERLRFIQKEKKSTTATR